MQRAKIFALAILSAIFAITAIGWWVAQSRG